MPGEPLPHVIAVGGLDPGGGAGLIRDFLVGEALGARMVLVGSAWTVQSSRGVLGTEPRSSVALAAALREALVDGPSAGCAVKIGMVATPENASALCASLATFTGPVVFDPVLAASSGGSLYAGAASSLLPLVRRATLVTPNLAEAAALTGLPVRTGSEARAAAHRLRALGARAVLVKGGHLEGDAVDLLVTDGEQDGDPRERTFVSPRVAGPSPRGTGCALATCLAVELARGRDLGDAVGVAKAWLHERICAARDVGGERRL